MTTQIVKVHSASQIPLSYLDAGIIIGILFCIVGLVMVLYTSKYYR
ncbi:hypothetical protein [Silvanigrella sp.]|jgi:hypothetical protein